MKRQRIIALLFALCYLIVPLLVMAGQTNDALSRLQGLLANLQTFQAQFVQITRAPKQEPQTEKGKFWMQRPNQFRWEMNPPDGQVIIADGKDLWNYDIDLKQITVQAQSEELDETPALLISGQPSAIGKAFTVSLVQANDHQDNSAMFELVPRNESSTVQKIGLNFWKKTLQSMRLENGLGQVTILRFSHVKNNVPIAAQRFAFVPPPGIDIIGEPTRSREEQ